MEKNQQLPSSVETGTAGHIPKGLEKHPDTWITALQAAMGEALGSG